MKTIEGYIMKDGAHCADCQHLTPEDGTRGDRHFHALFEDGSIAASFRTVDVECPECGGQFKNHDAVSKGITWSTPRVRGFTQYAFCSSGCRSAWWKKGAGAALGRIMNPATIETYLCDRCQAPNILVGVGQIMTRLEADRLIVTNQDGQAIADERSVGVDADCERCKNARVITPAPDFWYAAPQDFGYKPAWEEPSPLPPEMAAYWRKDAYVWDTDILVSVYELEKGAFQLWEKLPDRIELRMDRVVLQALFSTPFELNRWWAEPKPNDEGLKKVWAEVRKKTRERA
jgi:hypothetical protein